MASNDTTLEYDFVNKPSKDYFCPVTFEILTDPQQTSSCCGHHLSRAAADRLKREGKPCPICSNQPLKTTDDPFFRRQVMALKIRCSKRTLGCKWIGELGQLEEHMKVGTVDGKCKFVEVACPYECGEHIPRRSLRTHKYKKCVKRPFICQFCGHKGTYKDVTHDHKLQCIEYPLECPNKCCENDIRRRFLKRHLDQDCPLQEIECKFSYAGCGAKIQRRMMQEHMDESKDEHIVALATHVKTVTEKLEQFQAQLHTLSAAILQVASRPISILPPEFVLNNFEELKRNADRWCSPSFYTHVGGYKMCLNITANGWGVGEGTHVGISVYMMKGEFDDNLHWPFKGVVTVQLINQKEGGNHVEEKLVFENSKCKESSSRVLEGDITKVGWGLPKFISHSDLYRPEEGKEYLKNDTLKFKVSAVTVKSF